MPSVSLNGQCPLDTSAFFIIKILPSATEKLVVIGRELVDVKKEDGFAALHLAALNGHREVTKTLISIGHANPNITNHKKQTPILLAITQVSQ